MPVKAGVAAGHPATTEVGLRILASGGSAADAAVAAVLACSASESVLTGIGGGGFATFYDAATRTVTCLDFFCSIPGLDGDVAPQPMLPIEVTFGGVPMPYSIGGPSVGIPGVPAGCGEVHRRWGKLPWHEVVEPAVLLARAGVALPEAQARTLVSVAPALTPSDGGEIYAPGGRLLRGGETLHHPGLDKALDGLAQDGPAIFYTGRYGDLLVKAVRAAGGAIGPADLAAYEVLELPVAQARLAGHNVYARTDLNGTIATISALPEPIQSLTRPKRAVAVADALREYGRPKIGDTTNVSVVDEEGNACVITTTLGIGAGVWLPGLGINLNSMLGEGELITEDMAPGQRMQSMMCPLVVVGDDGDLVLAAGSAGASRIRTALVDTLLGVLVDGLDTETAVARPRFHVVDNAVHAELGYPEDELAALADAGYTIVQWDELNHFFGGVSAVGVAGAGGDPRRGGTGQLL
ncbi:gamma-glutamyltransferase [Asanoa sp. WMMD1127]|uniref:gamma-glutamyltransferase n=1 Tax=Asanoa sp. WMMD1127 TaxID=3016107 RepID=UPI0024161524|nr:gamma-glutamyltransferase [Asanoa sp. WMMD1127]MDG4821266.1 gamma-glutamyltransferase [Asanoa sp. WMMD1127]